MKGFLQIVFMCFFISAIHSQNSKSYTIVSFNLGHGGSSKVIATPKGNYKVSQSIGQSSVIGTHYGNGYYLRQGYQQPQQKIKIEKTSFKTNSLNAIVYPNPFEESVSIFFSKSVENEISVLVFDIAGKAIYNGKFSASQNILLNLNTISSGTYLLKVLSKNKVFNAKLIKK